MRFLNVVIFCFVSTFALSQIGNSYRLELQTVCLIDSISPTEQVQFYRMTDQNMTAFKDLSFDLLTGYQVQGTVKPCEQMSSELALLDQECYQADSTGFCDYSATYPSTKAFNLYAISANNTSLFLNYPYTNSVGGMDSLENDLEAYLTNNGFQFDSVRVDFPPNNSQGWEITAYNSEFAFQNMTINQNPSDVVNFVEMNCKNSLRNFEVYRNAQGNIALVIDAAGNVVRLPADAYKINCCEICSSTAVNADPCKVQNLTEQFSLANNVTVLSSDSVHSYTFVVTSGILEVVMSGTTITYPVGSSFTFNAPNECEYLQTQVNFYATQGTGILTVLK